MRALQVLGLPVLLVFAGCAGQAAHAPTTDWAIVVDEEEEHSAQVINWTALPPDPLRDTLARMLNTALHDETPVSVFKVNQTTWVAMKGYLVNAGMPTESRSVNVQQGSILVAVGFRSSAGKLS